MGKTLLLDELIDFILGNSGETLDTLYLSDSSVDRLPRSWYEDTSSF